MKNLLLIMIVFFAFNVNAKNNNCTIKGQCNNRYPSNIELLKMENGILLSHSKTKIDSEGNFGFLFTPEKEGFYFLGNEKDYTRIYVKKDDNINVIIDKNGYKLSGKNSKENKVLNQWFEMSKDLYDRTVKPNNKISSTFRDFFPMLEKINSQAKSFSSKIKSGNQFFDSLMKLTVKWDLQYYALSHLLTPHPIHPKTKDYTPFFNSFKDENIFNSDLLLMQPYYSRYINMYGTYYFKNILNRRPSTRDELMLEYMNFVSSSTLKGELISLYAKQMKSFNDFSKYVEKFGKYLHTEYQKQRMHELELSLRTYKSGEKAIDFTYPDKDGKMVSLSDFEGKLVLVDVWATWCGPCKKELPYLEELQKEFQGKDIVFMSVSVDRNKDKWLKLIEDKKPSGIQLCTAGDNKLGQDYKIKGIPRFMLFDKKGNILTTTAPKPSDPKLKEIIQNYLNSSN